MLWIKTAHLLFVIAWMAGVFYLPRILVHYVEGRNAGEDTRRLVIMADKLFRFSIVMAILAIVPGLVLWLYFGITGGWMHAKFTFVVFLAFYQWQTWRYISLMTADKPLPTSLFFRFFNEAALALVIPILILVVVKPF